MGVRGLSSYARQHDAAISEVRVFHVKDDAADGASASASANAASPLASAPRVRVAVDAWAWTYELWLNLFGGDTVQGGHYYAVSEHVQDFVHAWRSVGLEPVFFWDGPVPLVKQPTFLARRQAIASANSAFMRSSAASRASRAFQRECYPAPPLLGDAVRLTLLEIGVEIRNMPGEADSAVAEFAESQSGNGDAAGLAVSKDSDFFILCSRGAGRARYVPLDSVEYIVRDVAADGAAGETKDTLAEQQQSASSSTDGFEAVSTRKSRSKARSAAAAAAAAAASASAAAASSHTSSWPPSRRSSSSTRLSSIRLRAYSSHALATQLHLPPALLPLLGSVIGNDYSTPTQDSVLFRHLSRSTDKIREACQVVHEQWQRAMTLARDSRRAPTRQSLEIRLASRSLLKASIQGGGGGSDVDETSSEYSCSDVDASAASLPSSSSSATATPTLYGGSNTIIGAPSLQDDGAAPVVDRVRSLIEATVNALLERADIATHRAYYVSDGEKEACIDSIIESVAAYSLLSTVDSSHLFGKSRAAFLNAGEGDIDGDNASSASPRAQALAAYRQAWQASAFPTQLLAAMTERVCTMTIAPEDPDQKSVHVGAAREVRRWVYAILFQVWGMDWARDTMGEPPREHESALQETASVSSSSHPPPRYKEGERADDVISVDTESSGTEEEVEEAVEAPPPPPATSAIFSPPEEIKPPPAVVEYVRKGDRLIGDLVEIHSLTDMLGADKSALPTALGDVLAQYSAAAAAASTTATSSSANGQAAATSATSSSLPTSDPAPALAPLLPLRTRLDLYRHALQSGGTDAAAAAAAAFPQQLLPLAATLRHIVAHTARAAGESRKRINGTHAEVLAAVRAGCMAWHVFQQQQQRGQHSTDDVLARSHWVQPSTRGIHLASVLQLTLESSHFLASALLLSHAHLAPVHTLFDGPLLQYLLANPNPSTEILPGKVAQMADDVLAFVLHGQEDQLGIDIAELKRLRKENKKKNRAAAAAEEHERAESSEVESVAESVGDSVGGDEDDSPPRAAGKKKKKSRSAKGQTNGNAATPAPPSARNPFAMLLDHDQ